MKKKKIITKMKEDLQIKEFKYIFLLDTTRSIKILCEGILILFLLYISKIGWLNLSVIFRLFNGNIDNIFLINLTGEYLFYTLIISLICLQFLKIGFSKKNYIQVFDSLKKGLYLILKQGFILILVSIYLKEINIMDYIDSFIIFLILSMFYLIFSSFEKYLFKSIINQVTSEIIETKKDIVTLFGTLKDVPIYMFLDNSKWSKYLFRSKENTHFNSYNQCINDSLGKIEAIRLGETFLLRDFYSDYEISWDSKTVAAVDEIRNSGGENDRKTKVSTI